jgi:hypothetical protein
MGGSDRSRVFQNDKSVIIRIPGRLVPDTAGMGNDFDVRLLKDTFNVKLKDC